MHLSQLPSGRWRVAVKHGGRRRTATADTKAHAQLLGAEMEVELGARRRPDTVTVAVLLEAHLASADWSPTTRLNARTAIERIPEHFAERPVDDVDAATVAALFRELHRGGWSPFRIQRLRMILSTAWHSTAIPARWATFNPVRDAKIPKLPHRNITPPDSDVVDRLLDAATGQFELFLRLAVATGARRGELLALQWPDIDLERRQLRITRSLVWTSEGRTERDTKTSVKGHRTITLGARLTKRLAEHCEQQLELALAAGLRADGHVSSAWVFSHDAGVTPWRGDYATHEFVKLCGRLGITGVRLHDLRHHLATSLLRQGVPAAKVAQRVGHSSTATTTRIYGHWISDDADIADELDDRFG